MRIGNYPRPMRPVDKQFPMTLVFGAIRPGLWATHDDHFGNADFGCPIGTPVVAVEDGIISLAQEDPTGWGHYIMVKSGKRYYIYAHLSKWLVKVGDIVKKGQVIGLSGNTGNTGDWKEIQAGHRAFKPDSNGLLRKYIVATGEFIDDGAHLHFEIRENGTTKDCVIGSLFFDENGAYYH